MLLAHSVVLRVRGTRTLDDLRLWAGLAEGALHWGAVGREEPGDYRRFVVGRGQTEETRMLHHVSPILQGDKYI
jgi:hypothetical protein